MRELIYKDDAIYIASGYCHPANVAKEIAKLPAVEPEIIRCKDCAKHEYCRTSNVWATPPKDDWYCADAERRANDERRSNQLDN